MFSMYVGKVPEYLTTLFKKNSEFHSYNTKIGMKYSGATVWNLIAQEDINLEVSEAVFKKNLIRMINNGLF